jgi:hypothetical protein
MKTTDNKPSELEWLRASVKHGKYASKTLSIEEIEVIIDTTMDDVNGCSDYPHNLEKYSDKWTSVLIEFYSNHISPLRACEVYGSETGRYFHYDDPRNWDEHYTNRHNPENKVNKVLDN